MELELDSVRKFINSDVSYVRNIGNGSFGMVFEGTLKGDETERIAIKVPNGKLINDAMNELKFLTKLKHPNVVYFYGYFEESSRINLIFEFLNGDARTFVRAQNHTEDTLLGISYDIVLGMNYIHGLNILHRDLAARNVLVDSKNVAKISDFGLSRLVDRNAKYHYSVTPSSVFPLRWMPKESLPKEGSNGRFNKPSDIWSFGVALWEIWNKGEVPYRIPIESHLGLEVQFTTMSKEQVRNAISAGQNPMSFEIRQGMPQGIEQLLEEIFVEPNLRPTFSEIKIYLEKLQTNLTRGFTSKEKPENVFDSVEETLILGTKYRLNPQNEHIFSTVKKNNTVTEIRCDDISVKKIPEILRKFKRTEILSFFHTRDDKSGKCKFFNSSPGDGSDDCIFTLTQIRQYENLKKLWVSYLEVNDDDYNIDLVNLSALQSLTIDHCHTPGNIIEQIAHLFSLKEISLLGNSSLLEKNDVEALLRIQSLKSIQLNVYKEYNRQVISGSFAPIGPDGILLDQITQDAKITFSRDSDSSSWKGMTEEISEKPKQKLTKIDMDSKNFTLNYNSVEVLNSIKENNTAKVLNCYNISANKIPEILAKFKSVRHLIFHHFRMPSGECEYFPSSPEDSSSSMDCIFKLPQNSPYPNMHMICIQNLEINTLDCNIGPVNLPLLKTMEIKLCNFTGNNFIEEVVNRLFALENIHLYGNTPLLEKKDLETILKKKSLELIWLGKLLDRQIINGSFSVTAPDGKLFPEIRQDSKIIYSRRSNSLEWKQSIYKDIPTIEYL